MELSLTYEEKVVQALKIDLGISTSKPHCLDIELWRYAGAQNTVLKCRISLFTDDGSCIQGSGSTFGDAAKEIRTKLKPKTQIIPSNIEVQIVVPEPES